MCIERQDKSPVVTNMMVHTLPYSTTCMGTEDRVGFICAVSNLAGQNKAKLNLLIVPRFFLLSKSEIDAWFGDRLGMSFSKSNC